MSSDCGIATAGNDPDFRLSDYFDLIAGTSTGAIIAACLALGMSVGEVLEKYQKLGRNLFSRSWFRQGVIRARYDKKRLESELKTVFGSDTTLGGADKHMHGSGHPISQAIGDGETDPAGAKQPAGSKSVSPADPSPP